MQTSAVSGQVIYIYIYIFIHIIYIINIIYVYNIYIYRCSFSPKNWRDTRTLEENSALKSRCETSKKLSRGRHGEFGGSKTLHLCHTVDGRNPANQLRLVVYPNIYRVLYISGGCLGFQPSTVVTTSWWLLEPTQVWKKNIVNSCKSILPPPPRKKRLTKKYIISLKPPFGNPTTFSVFEIQIVQKNPR